MPAALALALSLGACADPAPPTCEDTEAYACFTGVFSELLGGPAEGVEVCTPELPEVPCTTSDEDGAWRLPGLPLDSDVLVTATYPDAIPTVFPQHSSMSWYAWYKVMVPQSILDTHASRLDATLREDRGHLLFLVWEGLNIDGEDTDKVEEAVATLSPAAELFYANGLGLADPDLTATSGSGSGGALNLEPGLVELSLESPGGACVEPSFHYAGVDGRLPVPVLEGFATAVDVICPAAD